jgi:hypothetical protein
MFGKYNKVGTRVYGGAPAIAPFGGTYTWWANINDAVFSNSGGINYVDEVPLTGISDRLVQPTAINRPEYNATGLDGNVTMKTTQTAAGQQQVIYKEIDTSVFNGGSGTLAWVGKLNSGFTFFTECDAGAGDWNFQVYSFNNALRLFSQGDGAQIIDASFTLGQFDVHHITLESTSLKHYNNGVLTSTITVTRNQNTAKPLTVFGYKALDAERGLGEMGDIAVLTGTALNATAIANDYTNFWKAKYPSLP